jgi:hypothetical protein
VTHTLTASHLGTGCGVVTRTPDLAAYIHGTVVTLTTTADADLNLIRWDGDAPNTGNPVTVRHTVKTVRASKATPRYSVVLPTGYKPLAY